MNDETAPKRYDWLRLYCVLPRNPKYQRLSSDSARVAYIHALLAAREEQVRGEWLDRSYVEAALGPTYAPYLDELLEVGLLVVDDDGSVRVPQWSYWNPVSASSAERVARHRAELRAAKAKLEAQKEQARARQERHRHPERFERSESTGSFYEMLSDLP